jgi:selenocysteine-specific elongation factor
VIVGTAGHIDHGKTTLVRALTGVDTDRLEEEKVRGISIELGYAYVPIESATIRNEGLAGDDMLGFVDVPGHERLIHTMAAGASGIDFALLVIAADDGVMPQTREHLAILGLLGVTRGGDCADQGRSRRSGPLERSAGRSFRGARGDGAARCADIPCGCQASRRFPYRRATRLPACDRRDDAGAPRRWPVPTRGRSGVHLARPTERWSPARCFPARSIPATQ